MLYKKYQVIYADPPWSFRVWSNRGKGRSAENHYQTQTIDNLCRMNIATITGPDAVLMLWATFPCLEQALQLGSAWGFTYKTVAFTWVKQNKKAPTLFLGMGYYTRANAELVLLFTKGSPLPRIRKDIPQILLSPVKRHSEKPDEIRDRIVRLFGDLPRIELFARDREGIAHEAIYAGWDVYGNQTKYSVRLPL
jgi:N6-adenosine-specific RNA methylase IME4